ncbi:hypothetical protein [Actinomadura litoris]|uniref:hypothetical protein n=1 Tax=Actinomadura litoris TaxID=2678616 RepID=UPI001FA6E2AB|nr:hypothetical protein [Actinomadura litoris]
MSQPGMRITLDAAMRARDVSPPLPEGEDSLAAAPPGSGAAARPGEPARRANASRTTKAAKNERRRLGKRGGTGRRPSPEAGA